MIKDILNSNRGFVLIFAVIIMIIAGVMIMAASDFFAKLTSPVDILFWEKQNYYYCQMGIYYAKAYVDSKQIPLPPLTVTFDTDGNPATSSDKVVVTIPARDFTSGKYTDVTARSYLSPLISIRADFALDADDITYYIASWRECKG